MAEISSSLVPAGYNISQYAPDNAPAIEVVQEAVADFLRLDVGNGKASERTLKEYMRSIRFYFKWCAEHSIYPPTATRRDLKEFRYWLLEMTGGRQRYSSHTAALRMTAVRRLYAALVENGIRQDDPTYGLKIEIRQSDVEKRINVQNERIPREVAQAVFTSCDYNHPEGLRDALVLALVGIEGLRAVEVHRLNLSDLRLNADKPYIIVTGKFSKSRRIFISHKHTLPLLQRWLDVRGLFTSSQERAVIVTLFHWQGDKVSQHGKRMGIRGLEKLVNRKLVSIGFKQVDQNGRLTSGIGQCLHSFRHSMASDTTEATDGSRMNGLQSKMGHEDPRTTQIYIETDGMEQDGLSDILADYYGLDTPRFDPNGLVEKLLNNNRQCVLREQPR